MSNFTDQAYRDLFNRTANPKFQINPAEVDLDQLSNGGLVHNGCGGQLHWGVLLHDPGVHGNVHVLECLTCRANHFHIVEEGLNPHRPLNIP